MESVGVRWPSPEMREGFLYNVLGRLMIAELVPEKDSQARRLLPIPAIDSLRVARGDLPPEFPIVVWQLEPFRPR
jgi:hypothetical protein